MITKEVKRTILHLKSGNARDLDEMVKVIVKNGGKTAIKWIWKELRLARKNVHVPDE